MPTRNDGAPQRGDVAPTLAPGRRLGDLTLAREIGRGNQGVVFEARQESLGRTVAVKILPKALAFTPDQVQRFQREAEAAGRLSHANIVAIHGLQEAEGHHLIIQELVTGGNLEDALAARRVVAEGSNAAHCAWAAGICRQLAFALQHAHARGVVHRDIKPGNVLLTADGVPKITDFGLAFVEDRLRLSQTGALLGTPHYMSPEQIEGSGDGVDARSDVYSLGVVLYKLLTFEVPFNGRTLQAIFNEILAREPKPPHALRPGIDADLEAICLKALEKKPADRFASAAAFGADLDRFLRGEPTLARPVGPLGRARRAVRRLATLSLVLIALLIPTLWLALDRLQLRPAAALDVAVHHWRLVGVACAALLLAWPLSVLGTRLGRGRRWTAAAAVLIAMAAGGAGARMVVQQLTEQQHALAWQDLQLTLHTETRKVEDLQDFVERWGSSFDADDVYLVTRAYLKRRRPLQAAEWAGKLQAHAAVSPAFDALMAAVFTALGDDEAAAAADARLAALAPVRGHAHAWEQIGDIRQDTGRHAAARAAYLTSAQLLGAEAPQRLNLRLAQVCADLCQPAEAWQYLRAFMMFNAEDVPANTLALRLACADGDWEAAGRYLAVIEASARLGPAARLEQRYAFLKARGPEFLAEAQQTARDVLARDPQDAKLVEWCARTALSEKRHQEAADLYARLLALGRDPVIALVGLSATSYQLVRNETAQGPSRFDEAIRRAREAIDLDPSYYEGHYDLGLAQRTRAMAEHGVTSARELPLDDLLAYVEANRRSRECNGLQPLVLNNLATALGWVHERRGDAESLQEGLQCVRRAVVVLQPETEVSSTCMPDEERVELSAILDTRRELEELAGDLPAALRSAQAARDILPAAHDKHGLRHQQVDRLMEALGRRQ